MGFKKEEKRTHKEVTYCKIDSAPAAKVNGI